MNFGSKSKKRVVLPSRPDPPTVEQIMEDVNRACPGVHCFTRFYLKASSSSSEVEARYLQSRRYIELHERLQEERGSLARWRDELRAAGESLEYSVMEVKRSAL
uniref:Si:ch73-238c9.1 n=1 Tax=Sinocyclocheilus anshuiensis TaxID=1608454 RepID=A0A671SC60_9TELE